MKLKVVIILQICVVTVFAGSGNEWNCTTTSNTGNFTKSNDCTINGDNHVEVSGTLEINGSRTDMNNLISITAANKHRHFCVNNANAKLILQSDQLFKM